MMHSPDDMSGRAALWFALLGGAGAWTAHLLLAYLIAEFGCVAGKDDTVVLGVMLPAWWLFGMSIVMVLIGAAATLIGRRAQKRIDASSHPAHRFHATGHYMARTGFLMSGLFTFFIIVQSIPIFFYLQRC